MISLIRILPVLTGILLVPAFAFAATGAPAPWQIGFQDAASPLADRLHWFHNDLLMPIITVITIFVLALLLFVIVRFNARANPVPSKTTHNVVLEVIWTVVPVIILIIIVIPSLKLLYYSDRVEKPDMTLKVTGYQWYWGYEYPDHGGVNFLSNMIPDKDINKTKRQVRQLSTDNPVVLPVDTNVQILMTAQDVIHAFTVPALGFKTDAIPGRLNEAWVRITKPGTYYGQCSELCGTGHGYMPIEIKAVSKNEFAAWIADQKKAQGIVDAPPAAETPAATAASTEQPAAEAAQPEQH